MLQACSRCRVHRSTLTVCTVQPFLAGLIKIDLASSLCKTLHCLVQGEDASIPDITSHVRSLPGQRFNKQTKQKLRTQAVHLWNTYNTTRTGEVRRHERDLARVGAFSIMLLASTFDVISKRAARCAELLNGYLICVRQCLKEEHLEIAHLLLEDAKIHCHTCLWKQEYDAHTNEQESACIVKYKCLYMLYGWKSDRSDLVTFWQQRVVERSMMWTFEHAEQVADIFNVFGADCINKEQYHDAVVWLERAQACVNLRHLRCQFERSDLKLNIMHTFSLCIHTK